MKTKVCYRSIGALIAVPFLILALYIDPLALVYSFVLYMFILICVTAGYHRLFSHAAYTTHKIWHWIFGLVGCISLNSSPAQWAMVHAAHHKYADTDKDPHETTWRYYFRFRDRKDISADRESIRLLRDPMHKFFLEHSFGISLIYGILITIFFNTWGLIFLYIVPVTMFLFITGFHTLYAHTDQGAQNRPWLEFLLPQAGEWLHQQHHITPKRTPFPGGMDIGGMLIELIRTDDTRSTNRTSG